MTCAEPTRFVILGRHVGWPVADAQGAAPLGPDDELRLADLGAGIDPAEISRFIPPSRLARACGPCAWYLIVAGRTVRVLQRDACQSAPWIDWLPRLAQGRSLQHPVAVAFAQSRLAVLDIAVGAVFVWAVPDGRLAARIPTRTIGPIAFGDRGDLFVAAGRRIDRYTPAGDWVASHVVVGTARIERMVAGPKGELWLATRSSEGIFALRRLRPDRDNHEDSGTSSRRRERVQCGQELRFIDESLSAERMRESLRPTGIIAASNVGFCLQERGPKGPYIACFRWDGQSACREDVVDPAAALEPRQAVVVTTRIDSGIPRCRWHRIRLDADIPPETSVSIEMTTTESQSGDPHDDDWFTAIDNATDILVRQPPGRYLILRIRLTGTTRRTPVVRRLRLDFPRATSLDHMPGVYREDPRAEDFSERFLALFDGSVEDLDRAIERFAVALDPTLAPAELLPWLGSFFGVIFDPGWSDERRRQILRALPELYRRRGTMRGVSEAIELIFDAQPAIAERFTSRAAFILSHNTRLRAARLFGRSTARFRLGRSALGRVPLRSYGNPDLDPFLSTAHQFSLLMPMTEQVRRLGIDAVDRLVASQKPAHTVHALRSGRQGFIVGSQSSVGVETVLAAPERPVLGGSSSPGTARLSRVSILRARTAGLARHSRVGLSAIVGIRTIME